MTIVRTRRTPRATTGTTRPSRTLTPPRSVTKALLCVTCDCDAVDIEATHATCDGEGMGEIGITVADVQGRSHGTCDGEWIGETVIIVWTSTGVILDG